MLCCCLAKDFAGTQRFSPVVVVVGSLLVLVVLVLPSSWTRTQTVGGGREGRVR